MGSTTFRLGLKPTIPGAAFDVLQSYEPQRDAVRFVQTVGGRAGFRHRGASAAVRSSDQLRDRVDDARAS